MGNAVDLAFNSVGTTVPVNLDWTVVPFNASFAVNLAGNATGTFTVQYTLQNPSNGTGLINWYNDANVASSTSTFVGNYMFPVQAVRLVMSSLSTNGTGAFSVLQGLPV